MASQDIHVIRQLLEEERLEGLLDPAALRQLYDRSTPPYPIPPGITIVPILDGGVPAERVTGGMARPGRTLLYLHGGGYVLGSASMYRHLAGAIVEAAAATLIVLDYRLAPEHPCPAAVEDALAAYAGLIGQGQDPAELAVAGDSAGGGLVLATLVRAREAGLPMPAAAVLISPWTDLAHTAPSIERLAGRDPSFDRALLVAMADYYLGALDPKTPLASPLYADLGGLPPLLIQVGAEELLLDDSARLDQRARAQGVDSVLEIWDEMVHSWHFYYPQLQEGRAAIQRLGAFIQSKVAGVTTAAP